MRIHAPCLSTSFRSLSLALLGLPLLVLGSCGGESSAQSDTLSASAPSGFRNAGAHGAGTRAGEEPLQVVSVNVVDGQVWKLNVPIRIDFNHPLDFATVDLNTVQIREQGGAPAVGQFSLPSPQTLVFQPACPTLDDFSDAGLEPGGVPYEVRVVGLDLASNTVRSSWGAELPVTTLRSFTTPTSSVPSALFLDTVVGPPTAVVRTNQPGDDTQHATYVEIGGDPAARHYFERDPGHGRGHPRPAPGPAPQQAQRSVDRGGPDARHRPVDRPDLGQPRPGTACPGSSRTSAAPGRTCAPR